MRTARKFELASAITSNFRPAGWAIVGKRDQYLRWKEVQARPDGLNLHETPGDPEAGPIPRMYVRAMVLGSDWAYVKDGVDKYGLDPVAVIEADGELLAGRFRMGEPAWPAEGGPAQAHIAPGIGQEALRATIALARPDNTLMPVDTWRMDPAEVENGLPGVPYSQLREQFPAAVWL